MISFNKHSKNKTINYSIIIKDLCCEYCLKGIIEDLLDIDGIESAESDFDYNNKKDVTINISYDSTLITEKEIKNLEIKLNS